MKKYLNLTVITVLLLTTSRLSYAQDATPTPVVSKKRVWTLEEIFNEKSPKRPKGKTQYCNGGRFEPCICHEFVTKELKYRPAVKECSGNAAVLFTGKYTGIFSVVVRDSENRDRWPLSDFGGCSTYERDTLGLNKCSAFKVQSVLRTKSAKGKPGALHCFGASGYSPLFKKVTRVTVKFSDTPNSTGDPLARFCLKKKNQPLN